MKNDERDVMNRNGNKEGEAGNFTSPIDRIEMLEQVVAYQSARVEDLEEAVFQMQGVIDHLTRNPELERVRQQFQLLNDKTGESDE